MKCRLVLAVLGFLIWPAAARGLKTVRVPDATSAVNQNLEAENALLKKRNAHLQAMMQVARTEVHRMDDAVKGRHDNGGSNADVIGQEVEDLKSQLLKVEADKKSLVNTLRQMLAKNSTQIFRKQADHAVKEKQALEMKCGQERMSFEAQIKEADGKCEETKEMAQTLQEQNMDLQKAVHGFNAKLVKSEQKDNDLSADKANLVDTMHSLMRENTNVKKQLQIETQNEKKATQQLAAVEAKISKLTKNSPPKVPLRVAREQVARAARKIESKDGHLHMKHEESMTSKFAKMKDINRYIDNVNDDNSDDVPEPKAPQVVVVPAPAAQKDSDWGSVRKSVDAMQQREEKAEMLKGAAAKAAAARASAAEAAAAKDADGMSPIDALDPEAVKQQKASEETKAKVEGEDGGDDIQALLAQAKDQLHATDAAEAQN